MFNNSTTPTHPEQNKGLKPDPDRLFSDTHYGMAASMIFCQCILIPVFAVNGYGYEYVLLTVLFINLGLFVQIKRQKQLSQSALKPFEIVKAYVIMTACFYSIPLMICASCSMLNTTVQSVDREFIENNKYFVLWLTQQDILNSRPRLDITYAPNILNIYYQTLAILTGSLSAFFGLLLIPFKITSLKKAFSEDSFKNQSGFFEVFRLFVFSFLTAYFISFYKYKYTFGYATSPSGESFSQFNWITQIGAWCLMGSCFSFILAGAIATGINIFSFNTSKDSK